MRLRTFFTGIIPFLLIYGLVHAGQFASGIVLSQGGAFFVEAPNGWLLDNESGVGQNLHAVFYPKNSTWQDSKVRMCAFSVPKSDARFSTLGKAMEHDKSRVRGKTPNAVIQPGKELTTKQGKTVQTLHFLGAEFGNYEAVAYIDGPKAVDLLVFSARNDQDFNKSLASFEELVESYLPIDKAP